MATDPRQNVRRFELVRTLSRKNCNMIVEIVIWLTATIVSICFLTKSWFVLTKGRFKSDKTMTGRTVLITGANRGLGKVIALDMAKRRARVILACRDLKKANEAVNDIKRESGNEDVLSIKLDLSDFDSVRVCVKRLEATEKRLHVLINNAGIVADKSGFTNAEGLELHFATNHFGHFLLTTSLLPLILRTPRAKIVNLTSYFHFAGKIDLNDIYGRPGCSVPQWMYANTKLANVLFTRELADTLKGTGVTVNAVNPGNTESDIASQLPDYIMFFSFIIKYLALKKPSEGAQTVAHAILSDEVDNVSGEYLSDCGQAFSSPASKNLEMRKWLWKFSQKVTKSPSIDEIVLKSKVKGPNDKFDINCNLAFDKKKSY